MGLGESKKKVGKIKKINTYIVCLMLIAGGLLLLSAAPGLGEPETSFWNQRYDYDMSGCSGLTSNIVEPSVAWIFSLPNTFTTSPSVGDINGDGEMEIVFSDSAGTLYALDKDGNELWHYDAVPYLYSSPSIGNIDADMGIEIVFSSYYWGTNSAYLYALNGEDGSLVWKHTLPKRGAYTGTEATPVLYDINVDGYLDIFLSGNNYKFYAINGPDGAVIWESQFQHFMRVMNPVGDIDKDGKVEVLAVDNHAIVRLFEMDGTVDWQVDLGHGLASTPVFADVNGDGYKEVIFFIAGGLGHIGSARVYNYDGTLLWESVEHTFFYSTPTVVDINGDGKLDIVGGDSNDHLLVAYRGYDGTVLWTRELPGGFLQAGLITADIDGDGEIEILANGNPNLFSVNSDDGTIDWTFDTEGQRAGAPLVVNLDNNGYAKILLPVKNRGLYCIEANMDNNARHYKEGTIEKLEAAKTGDKKIDDEIDKAIEHIEKSLKEKLWVDDTHLDVKDGKKVFYEEEKAVKHLQKLIKDKKVPDSVKEVCREVIDDLVRADQILAYTAYEEALVYAGDPKVDKELEKCLEDLIKAEKEIEKGHHDHAIDQYKKAWEHAQKAIKEGKK